MRDSFRQASFVRPYRYARVDKLSFVSSLILLLTFRDGGSVRFHHRTIHAGPRDRAVRGHAVRAAFKLCRAGRPLPPVYQRAHAVTPQRRGWEWGRVFDGVCLVARWQRPRSNVIGVCVASPGSAALPASLIVHSYVVVVVVVRHDFALNHTLHVTDRDPSRHRKVRSSLHRAVSSVGFSLLFSVALSSHPCPFTRCRTCAVSAICWPSVPPVIIATTLHPRDATCPRWAGDGRAQRMSRRKQSNPKPLKRESRHVLFIHRLIFSHASWWHVPGTVSARVPVRRARVCALTARFFFRAKDLSPPCLSLPIWIRLSRDFARLTSSFQDGS